MLVVGVVHGRRMGPVVLAGGKFSSVLLLSGRSWRRLWLRCWWNPLGPNWLRKGRWGPASSRLPFHLNHSDHHYSADFAQHPRKTLANTEQEEKSDEEPKSAVAPFPTSPFRGLCQRKPRGSALGPAGCQLPEPHLPAQPPHAKVWHFHQQGQFFDRPE